MAQAYSMDLRERVLKDCDTGMRSEDVAQKYSVIGLVVITSGTPDVQFRGVASNWKSTVTSQ